MKPIRFKRILISFLYIQKQTKMLTISFLPFPIIESDRLLLRQVSKDDVDEVIALRGNPENMKYIPRPLVTTTAMALEHIAMITEKIEQNIGINWAITLKGNTKLLGIIGHYIIKPQDYRSEIGYMLLPEYHNKGITAEAINVVLNYGFEVLNLHSVEAIIDPNNIASAKVLEKNGFKKEAHLKENIFWNNRFYDSEIYSLLNRNFKLNSNFKIT